MKKLCFSSALFVSVLFIFGATPKTSAAGKLCHGSIKCSYQDGCYTAKCVRSGEGCNRECGFLEIK